MIPLQIIVHCLGYTVECADSTYYWTDSKGVRSSERFYSGLEAYKDALKHFNEQEY